MNGYEDWMTRMIAGEEGRKLSVDEFVRTSAGEPFKPIQFLRTDRAKYIAEIGQRGDDFIYHFYPSIDIEDFESKMALSFLEVFKLDDRLQADFTPEFGSWAVRAVGFAANLLSDSLVTKVFDVLDKRLG